tara:strand:- start:834 stop:2417 length:1584 start_codon:yes stop_codon:yes gene_type:complete
MERLKFSPIEVYQFTASAKPTKEVKLDWSTFIDAALKLKEDPNKMGLPLLCECSEGYRARIQIREMKGLAGGSFKDVRFLATYANGVSEEFNDKDFEFNNFRISARITLSEIDTGKQISQANLDFQVYRNGNFRMGLGNLSKLNAPTTEAGTFIFDVVSGEYKPTSHIASLPFSVTQMMFMFLNPHRISEEGLYPAIEVENAELKLDTIKARFQFNGNIKSYEIAAGTFPEILAVEPELMPCYYIKKLDGIDPGLFENKQCKNFATHKKGPGRWPILMSSNGVVHITRCWSIEQLYTMYTRMMSFIREMHKESIIELGDFAPRTAVDIEKQKKPPKAVNYKIKKKEELIEILRRNGVHQMPIPTDGEGIYKSLLVDLVESKIKEKTEELIDAGLAELKENVEPDTEHRSSLDLEFTAYGRLEDRNMVDSKIEAARTAAELKYGRDAAELKENVEPDTECLMADEFLYSPTKPKVTQPPPGLGYSPKSKKIHIEDVALEAATAFRDKNVNTIIHKDLPPPGFHHCSGN